MKMFKKIMAVALVGVMALSMLTGCAITDAMKENAAERGLEAAVRSIAGKDVEFTRVNKAEYKNAMKDVKTAIKDKKYKDSDAAAVESATTDDYSVVVIAEPKSAKTEAAWQQVGLSIVTAAFDDENGGNGIYAENVDDDNDKPLKAKVHIEAVEGVDAEDKAQTYFVFVFAATEGAYNK